MPTLSLNLSSANISLKLNPVSKTFDSTNLDVSVATNNLNGYKLYLNTIEDTTSLTRQNDGTSADSLNATIETLPSSGESSCANGCTESTFPTNYWGYRISSTTGASGSTDSGISDFTNTKYFPFTPSAIISSSEGTTNEITSTLSFASKIDYNRPSGVYNLNLNFQALPKMSNYYMQDFYNNPELAEQLCTEDPTMVMDKRDGHTYAIARLKDGKCWMLQNLRLGSNLDFHAGSITITSEDSNIASGTFVLTNRRYDRENNSQTDGVMPQYPISDDVFGGTSYYYNASAFFCPYHGSYTINNFEGCYYNWYTATAGVGSSEITGKDHPDGVNVDDSICPKGWKLPSGGPEGEFNNLYSYYLSVSQMLVANPRITYSNTNGGFQPGYLLSGYYNDSGGAVGSISADGDYWSRTASSNGRAYRLYTNLSTFNSEGSSHKYSGRSIRCLAQ